VLVEVLPSLTGTPGEMLPSHLKGLMDDGLVDTVVDMVSIAGTVSQSCLALLEEAAQPFIAGFAADIE